VFSAWLESLDRAGGTGEPCFSISGPFNGAALPTLIMPTFFLQKAYRHGAAVILNFQFADGTVTSKSGFRWKKGTAKPTLSYRRKSRSFRIIFFFGAITLRADHSDNETRLISKV
jgi:hypothetical protein